MSKTEQLFESADAFQDDVTQLPVPDIDVASSHYSSTFGMAEISRSDEPVPQVVLERDGVAAPRPAFRQLAAVSPLPGA